MNYAPIYNQENNSSVIAEILILSRLFLKTKCVAASEITITAAANNRR